MIHFDLSQGESIKIRPSVREIVGEALHHRDGVRIDLSGGYHPCSWPWSLDDILLTSVGKSAAVIKCTMPGAWYNRRLDFCVAFCYSQLGRFNNTSVFHYWRSNTCVTALYISVY